MLKRIKETLTCINSSSGIISNLKSHLLHSDKSTYFYKSNGKGFFRLFRQPDQYYANGMSALRASLPASLKKESGLSFCSLSSAFRCASPHHDLNESATDPRRVNRTQRSREITPYSAIPGRPASITPLMLSAFGLILVLGIMICPLTPASGINEAYATGEDSNDGSDGDTGISTQMTVPTSGVALELNTTLPEDKTIVEQVTGSGTKYISVNFTVGANDIDKYQVFVQADNSNLVGYTNKDTITSIATPTAGGNLIAKTWGYSVAKNHNVVPSTMTYNTIQTNVSTAADTVEATTGSKLTNITQPYTLAFAANLDGAKADHYKSNITLSVAANAEQVTTSTEFLGFYGINYMQDMTPAICEKARVGEVARLIDKRDQKLYWIGKLADNNCWMTQNLDLDLWDAKTNSGVKLTPDDTDIESSWVSTTGQSTITFPINKMNILYFDPGDYVLLKPAQLINACGGSTTDFSQCDESLLANVSGLQASSKPDFGTQMTSTEYNAHYLLGNYYSWGATTAGQLDGFNDAESYPVEATQSICPKGWSLPTLERSYSKLLEAYGYIWTPVEEDSDVVLTTSLVTNTGYNLKNAPLYFAAGGNIMDSSSVLNVGLIGEYHTAVVSTYMHEHALGFNNALQIANFFRGRGRTVRCVAR